MEEEKAAEYYDELTRKGEGAARFKQGLGFSSPSNDAVPTRGSALPSSSPSFLSSFVRASSPSKSSKFEKEAQLANIQNKLKKKPNTSDNTTNPNQSSSSTSRDRVPDRDRHPSRRNRSRSPSRDNRNSRRHRSTSRDRESSRVKHREKDRDRDRGSRKRRTSRSRSVSDEDRGRQRGSRRSRSSSPRNRKSDKVTGEANAIGKTKNSGVDYAKFIQGYESMMPAQRIKAKMKLQLSETAKKDATNGMGSGWERFDFDKDAPLSDEEIEAGEDDGELMKHIGQSFRLNAVKTRREDEIKAAHDEAMFGVSSVPPSVDNDIEIEEDNCKLLSTEMPPVTNLISNQVLAMQKGSWRDRVGKK